MSLNPRISAGVLVCISLASVDEILRADMLWTYVTGLGLFAFFLLEWPRLAKTAKALVVFAILLGAVMIFLNKMTPYILAKAVSRAGFLTFFMVSLALLQNAADSSLMVRRCGKAIVHQPPGRRYFMLAVGASFFSAFLSIGTISLLGTMVKNGIDSARDTTEDQVSEIRLQRMTVAILRGFCTIVFWSPVTLTLAIVLTALPELSWIEIQPYGFIITICFLFIGWLLDRSAYPRSKLSPVVPKGAPLTVLYPLFGLMVLIFALAALLANILTINLISALLITIPFISLGWVYVQYWRGDWGDATLRSLSRAYNGFLPALPNMRSEISIFAASAFIGLLVPPLIDVDALGGFIVEFGLGKGWILTLSFWIIIMVAMIGINPIISVTIALDLLPRLPQIDIAPLSIAIMAITAWSIIVGFSPLSAAVRIAGRVVDRDIVDIGFRWNGQYSLIVTALFSVALLVFT
ncbi:MAG: hypothetical protein COA78_15635 [Blastopirellula sp.]|nr:MAG: hypothetical protein COA78_15635 [Blastopirellula sp.]